MELEMLVKELFHITNSELLQKLVALATVRSLKKKEITLKIGEMQTKIEVLLDGIVRCYFLDESNREITDCFIVERGYPVMVAALSQPSLISAQAVVDSTVLELPLLPVMGLMEAYPELLWVYNQMLQKALFFHWQIKNARYCYTAQQRYQWFLQNWPGVETVANSYHIASFLGVTPETLSRLRRAAKQGKLEAPTQLMVDPHSEWTAEDIPGGLRSHRQDGKPQS